MPVTIENNQITILNPATLNEVGKVNVSNKQDVDTVLKKAKEYNKWSSLSLKKRCAIIHKFRKIVFKNSKLLKKTIKDETGKKDFIIFTELLSFLDHAKTMSKVAKYALKKNSRNPGLLFKNKRAYVQYEPLGVAGIVSPWNFPLATPMKGTIEALLAGNNVILKPSEYTPLTSLFMKKLWDEYIGYNDAFQIINGAGDVGSMLVESPVTDIISFTGSTKVGLKIAKTCSSSLKPCILELGGKDPMIILKDASIKRTVESALHAGLFNAGQTCISTEEIYVEDDIVDKFKAKLSLRIKDIKSGGSDSDDIGPIITDETKQKINEHINEVKDSCDIFSGINNGGDKFIAPTIVVNPPDSSRLVNEETFGPVMSIRSFKSEDELIKKIHKTGYGLSSSIFGKDKKRINRIIKRMKIGNVNVNDVMTSYAIVTLPFGGEGISGLGKQHGVEGLRSFCRVKSIVVNRFNFIDEPMWIGRPKVVEKVLEKITNLLFR